MMTYLSKTFGPFGFFFSLVYISKRFLFHETKKKGKVAHEPRRPTGPELNLGVTL